VFLDQSCLHLATWSIVALGVNCFTYDYAKLNCANIIIFGQTVMQTNYEHMHKQERTKKILITDYAVVNACWELFVFLCIFVLHSEIKPAFFAKRFSQINTLTKFSVLCFPEYF